MRRFFTTLVGPVLLFGACVALAGCSDAAREGPGGAPPPPTVTVSRPIQKEITDYAEYTGRTAAVESVQVRARVNGYLEKVHFKEGAEVTKGAVLYEIDPRPYAAALRQADSQITLQEAQLRYQEAVYQRNVRLRGEGQAVSPEEVQQSRAQRDTTRASLEA